MLVQSLGDRNPRHVGGIGGGYIEEGQWAARRIALEYGAESLPELLSKAKTCLVLPFDNPGLLRQLGFQDVEMALYWRDGVSSHYKEMLSESKLKFSFNDVKPYLQSDDKGHREAAAAFIAIAGRMMYDGVPYLIKMLGDSDSNVKETALKALCIIRGKGFMFGNQNARKWEKWWAKR